MKKISVFTFQAEFMYCIYIQNSCLMCCSPRWDHTYITGCKKMLIILSQFKEDSLLPLRLAVLFTSFTQEFMISILRQINGTPKIGVMFGFPFLRTFINGLLQTLQAAQPLPPFIVAFIMMRLNFRNQNPLKDKKMKDRDVIQRCHFRNGLKYWSRPCSIASVQ